MKKILRTLLRYTGCLLVLGSICGWPGAASAVDMRRNSGFDHDFWLYYVAVQHSLKGNMGEINSAAELDRINPNATRFLAKFWWKKIQRDCAKVRGNISISVAYYEKDEVDIMQNVDEELKYCAYDVMYKHWTDINTTITNRLKTERMDTRAAILSSLQAAGLTSKGY